MYNFTRMTILFVYFFHCFNNIFLSLAFLYLLQNYTSFYRCPKKSSLDELFPCPAFFVILSQIPKQIFVLDNSLHIPHLWYLFVNIVDNFVYNSVFPMFLQFFLGITSCFFHKSRTKRRLAFFITSYSFVQFAQKATCQSLFHFFYFLYFQTSYHGN